MNYLLIKYGKRKRICENSEMDIAEIKGTKYKKKKISDNQFI